MFSTAASSPVSRPDLSPEVFPPNPSDFFRPLASFLRSTRPWLQIPGRSSTAAASRNLKEALVGRLSPPAFSNPERYPRRLCARGHECYEDERSG